MQEMSLENIKQYIYYVLIGVLSFVCLAFFPLLESSISGEPSFPTDGIGWAIWATTKGMVALINILIYVCFMKQAEVNVKDDPNFQKANEILILHMPKERLCRSPRRWKAQQYGFKGTTIAIGTLASTMILTEAILSYDYIALLTYLLTITMGVVFGVLQMKCAENYWTDEYYHYALQIETHFNATHHKKMKGDTENAL